MHTSCVLTLAWRNRLAQESYTFKVVGSSPAASTMSTNPNNYQQQKLRGLKRKYEIVQMRGGKCERCGYNKNLAALDFHHRNPDTKKF